jgi:hypothetical protein
MRTHATALVVLFSMFHSAGVAAEEKPAGVDGLFVILADDKSIEDVTLLVRLYEFDPRLADAPATLVDKLEIAKVKHTKGEKTEVNFAIGGKVEIKPMRRYYVTVHGYSKGKVEDNAHYVYYGNSEKGGPVYVFADGNKSTAKFTGKRLKD